jgi:hypothetical protein
MQYSQSPPLVEKDWTAEETSYGGPPRDLDARSDQRIGMRPKKPSIQQVESRRPSISRRIFRTLTRFSTAVLIGIGATLGWQSHGDTAREIMVARVPTLAWLLSVSTTKSPALAAATSPDPVQQLGPMASNLDVVRRSVEQLAAKQDQMSQNIATMQAVEEDIRQKMSAPPPSQAVIPQHKPAQPKTQSSAVQPPPAPRPPPAAGPIVLSR